MDRASRILKRIFLITGLLLLLAILVIGVVSAALNWQGVCDEATGGQVPCSRVQFALREMFWAAFLFIPYFFVAALVLLGMSLTQFIASLVRKRRPRS